jgi:hypothetical protein
MASSLENPSHGRRSQGGPSLGSRERIVALALGVVLALLLVATLAAAVSGSGPFAGDDSGDDASNGLPSGWVSLEPLLPLAPGLKEMSAFKRSAAGGASRVLAARADGGGALRLRALPRVGAEPPQVSSVPKVSSVRTAGPNPAPRSGLRPAAFGVVPAVDRIVGLPRRLLRRPLGDLQKIIDRELDGLPGGTVGGGGVRIPPIKLPLPNGVPRPPVVIPPIDPLPGVGTPPGGNPVPGNPLPGGRPGDVGLFPGGGPLGGRPRPRPLAPINVTLGNLRADSRFDVLLVSSGRRVLERYVFLDRDIAGLSAQINLGSRLLAAEVLRDEVPLARVAAAPLSVGGANAALLGGGAQAGGRTRGGSSPGAGPGPGAPPQASAAGAGGGDRPQRGRRSGAGSVGGGGSSSPKSAQGSPRRAGGGSNATRPSTRGRSRPRRASPGSGSPRGGSPRGRNRPARRGNGGSPPRGRRSSPGSGRGHDKGHGRDDDKGHGRDDDEDDDDD